MLKIVHVIDSFDSSEKETLAFLSVLQNKSNNIKVLIITKNDADKTFTEEISKYFSKPTIILSHSELVSSSCIFDKEDIIMPVFSGEFFSYEDIEKAYSSLENSDACVVDPAFEENYKIDLIEKKDIFAEFSDKLCLVKYNCLDKNIFADLDFSCPDETRALLLSYVCLNTNELTVVHAQSSVKLAQANPRDLSWYSDNFFQRYENLGRYCLNKYEHVPYFIQYLIGYQLLRRFNLNRSKNCICAEVCTPEHREVFLANCQRILKFVDNRVFMRLDGTHYMRFPEPGIAMLSDLKKGKTDLSVSFQAMKTNNTLYCCIDNCLVTSIRSKSVTIRQLKIQDDSELHLTAFTNGVFEALGCKLKAFCDNTEVEVSIKEKEILSFFAAPIFERDVYDIIVPVDLLHNQSTLRFAYEYGINEYRLKVDHTSKPKISDIEIALTPGRIIVTDESLPAKDEVICNDDLGPDKEKLSDGYSCLVLISDNGSCESVSDTVNDIISKNDSYHQNKLHIAIITKNKTAYSSSPLSKAKNIYFYCDDEYRDLNRFREIIKKHNCDLVTHINSCDITDSYYFDDAVGYAQEYTVSTVAPFVTHDDTYIGFKNTGTDLFKKPWLTPINYNGIFYKTELFFDPDLTTTLWTEAISVNYEDERDIAVFCLLTRKDKRILLLNQHAIFPANALAQDGKSYTCALEYNWYFPSVQTFFLWIEALYPDNIPITVQYTLINRLLLRLNFNENLQDTHVITPELLPDWKSAVEGICQRIDDEVIADVFLRKRFHAPPHISRWILQVKHGNKYSESVVVSPKNLSFKSADCQILLLSNQTVQIEVMDYTNDYVVLECSTAGFFEKHNIFPQAELNGNNIRIENSCHYAHRKLFAQTIWKRYTFRVKLPFSELSEGNLIFSYSLSGYKYPLKISTGRYTSKLNRTVPGSYWVCNKFIFSFNNNFSALKIEPYSKTLAREKEANLRNLCIESVPYEERENVAKLMKIRKKYFSTRSRYQTKNIWVTFDKLYKAGDNADYFYRYAVNQKDGVDVHYVINKGYPDANKFLKDKLKPLYFTSMKHILHFLNSRIIATTHAGLPVFSGIVPKNFKYVQDLFNADVVCIQHGLAVQWMPHNLYAGFDNTKRFYCATQSELNNLSKPEYGYSENALRLTGLARYDGLVNASKRQILISPTWRSYIAMPSSAGNTRPYSETFKETEYFKIYNSLINNPKLSETAERCNYHIVYLLHPTLSNQIDDFTPAKGIEVRSPVGESYEKMMTESDLMITDFSGIQFDFAYMRKPIVYYHPDALPAGYEEGGFSYNEQAFGPICKDESTLVDTVCKYMEQDCRTDDFYLQRQNSFFAFNDHNNCRRIYDEILDFSKQQRSENREVINFGFTCVPTLQKQLSSDSDKKILEWSCCENCSGYEILCSCEHSGMYMTIANLSSEINSYEVPSKYEECFFKVRARFYDGEFSGDCSNTVFL